MELRALLPLLDLPTVIIFLLEYDPAAGKLVRLINFGEAELDEAHLERLAREKDNFATGLDREVVLLEAESEEALRRTHGRYFYTPAELWGQFMEALENPPEPSPALVNLFREMAESHEDYAEHADLARQEIRQPKGETVEELRRQLG